MHVDDVVLAQVDFRRAARAFQEHESAPGALRIARGGQAVIRGGHAGKKLPLAGEVVAALHLPA